MKFTPNVKVRREKRGCVVFDTLREKVFVTNETGARIVAGIEAGLTPEALVAQLSAEYDQPAKAIEREVKQFIKSLRSNGLALAEETER
jgi:hypothetical protein